MAKMKRRSKSTHSYLKEAREALGIEPGMNGYITVEATYEFSLVELAEAMEYYLQYGEGEFDEDIRNGDVSEVLLDAVQQRVLSQREHDESESHFWPQGDW